MKLKDFINGFRKIEYRVELADKIKPFVDSVAVAELMNTLQHIPFYDIKFSIDDYKVEKLENFTISTYSYNEMKKTGECESFTKISCREIPNQNLRDFYVKNILFVMGIDGFIWKITVAGHIGGRVYTRDFDSYIVNSFITYCNNYLKATHIDCILKTDCMIKFLEEKSKLYKRYALGYTIHESSSMLWTSGAREESYVTGFSSTNICKDLDIEVICPDYEEDDTFGMSIPFADPRLVSDDAFEKRFADIIKRQEELRSKPMVVPVYK
jgi:hypothetical protein